MPNVHGQITRDDFKAPEGKFRIMREEMSDGQLTIVADFNQREFADLGLESARATHPKDFFTLCDENGVVEEHDWHATDDPLNEVSDRDMHNMYKK